jgi:O-antigen ligase
MVATHDPRIDASASYRTRIPFLLGCLFLVSVSFPGLGELPGGISLPLVFMLACAPIWFSAASARDGPVLDEASRKSTAIILFFVAFLILWSVVSVFGAPLPFRAGRYILSLVGGFTVYFLLLGTLTRERLAVYLDVLCITLAFTSFMSFIAYYEPHLRQIVFMGTDRAAGFFKNPNQFGIAISTVLPVAVAIFLGQPGRRPAWAVCLGLLLFGLIASGSKTNLMLSWITFVLMLCMFSFVAFKGPKRIYMVGLSIVAAVLLVLGGAILLSQFNPRALRLLTTFLEQDEEVKSLIGRQVLWQYSFDQFMADPIRGEGAGQLISVGRHQAPHSHNVFLDYLRTLGAPGFFGLLIILVTATLMSVATATEALRARAASPRHRILCLGLAIGCLSYIAANMSSDSMGPSTSPFFWLVLFLGLSSRSLLRSPVPRNGQAAERIGT